MGLDHFLLPNEEIQYKIENIKYGNQPYNLYITNMRIMLYIERGLVLKKVDFIAFKMKEIQNVMYKEEGLINKKGVLILDRTANRISLTGSPNAIRTAYQNIMRFWGD